jgi:predicted nucleotidyltransferase
MSNLTDNGFVLTPGWIFPSTSFYFQHRKTDCFTTRNMENRLPELLKQTVDTIAEAFQPERIVLFGSHARGDADQESDIDLFVEMETRLSPPERAIAISNLFGLRSWSLDLVVYTPDEVKRLKGIHGTLLSEIEQEGQVLYERG